MLKPDIIERVAPMSTSLQCMPDRCTTKYFMQVDEDMMLNKDTVSTQYKNIHHHRRRLPSLLLIFMIPMQRD
ncbi:MAG: hypothetical protein GWO07_13895 [Candidatus Dadabacteria bacterium]|nr:hypothetical protein [Candidatus Dadabacteria bacterium]NIS09811.1 hypothetical protein [Candidatus Dadabacteria bacterium]NIV41167.1 hypothetical protein [Candidatus Dadabacteria bacterium]NIX16251.1 hypothetical protein [Candidatus Dadabacteria bacterium]NIY22872.1 hypothetical protein [Candidatus Dadabacteria bacterium]